MIQSVGIYSIVDQRTNESPVDPLNVFGTSPCTASSLKLKLYGQSIGHQQSHGISQPHVGVVSSETSQHCVALWAGDPRVTVDRQCDRLSGTLGALRVIPDALSSDYIDIEKTCNHSVGVQDDPNILTCALSSGQIEMLHAPIQNKSITARLGLAGL